MAKRSKLKDIADALGISIATVSRALNNKLDISQETKRKVLKMANELDYKSNSLAINLRNHNINKVVGVVIPVVNHYFFSTVLKGIMARAHLHNYLVLVGESLHKPIKEKQILNDFMDFNINGLLLAPSIGSKFEQNLLPFMHRRIPTVVMDRIYPSYNGNYVLTDDFKGALVAMDHLFDEGYENIAHIGSTDPGTVGLERKKGFLESYKRRQKSVDPKLIIEVEIHDTELGINAGYEAARKLMESKNQPDAIFAVTDDVALGVYKYAKENNINIPNDLGVVGFSNSLTSRYVIPSLSTVEQNGVAMGHLAFEYFYKALHSNGHIFQQVFEPTLLVRESSVRKVEDDGIEKST